MLNILTNSKQNFFRQTSVKCGKHRIKNTLRALFIKKNQERIQEIANRLKADCVISLPRKMLLSVAKIQIATQDFLELMEYSQKPNYDNLKDFTGGAIGDTDIANYESYLKEFQYLDDVYINELGDKECVLETISDGSYESTELNDCLYETLNLLSKSDRNLLMMKFGLGDFDEHTNEELAKLYKASKEQIDSKVDTALQRAKAVLETMI